MARRTVRLHEKRFLPKEAQDWTERRPRQEAEWEIRQGQNGEKEDRLTIRETAEIGPPSLFSPENRYATLEILRQYLSLWQVEQDELKAGMIRLPDDRATFARTWARVVSLVVENSLPRARRRYHRLPRSTPADRHARLLALTYLTAPGGLGRVKRCEACGEWFVDYSRNRSGKRCSRDTWRWWNRERRRKAGQPSQRRGISRA